jgi:hypothetical protein
MIGRGVALAAALVAVAAPRGWAQSPAEVGEAARDNPGSDCFYVNQLQGNHALSDHAVIFRVNAADFYRMEFSGGCPALTFPQPKLILTPVGGIGLVCHAIDLDVKVGQQGPGFPPESCIPTALHRMTPAEVAAVPKGDLP